MSVVYIDPNAKLTVTAEDLRDAAKQYGIDITKPDEEKDYTLLLNATDAIIKQVDALPDYIDPRLLPDLEDSGERTYERPPKDANPINAWSHKCHISLKAPKDNRLAGRTICVKDNVSVAGLPLTAGTAASIISASGEYPISPIDATVVTRVLQSGAILKGTASCENFSLFALSYTSGNGVIDNPWMPGTVGGGSSSGCAALLAITQIKERQQKRGEAETFPLGEGIDLAIGGDQGGSIRLPAAYAGVYGLKPTHGLVPYTGIVSLYPMIDHCGPMARSVRDIALLLSVIAGYDGLDPRMTPESPLRENVKDYAQILDDWKAARISDGTWTSTSAASGLKVGLVKEAWEVPALDPDVSRVVREAAQRFASLGAVVEEVSIPLHAQGANIWAAVTRRDLGDYACRARHSDTLSFPLPHVDPPAPSQSFYDEMTKANPAVTNVLFNSAYLQSKYSYSQSGKAQRLVHKLRAEYDQALAKYDVLITPTNSFVGKTPPAPDAGVMERMQKAVGSTSNTAAFNVTGHPAMSMPVGWAKVPHDPEKVLPVGMQVIAKRFDEETLLKAAMAWEVGGLGLDS
ncbi:hypothetical protein VTN02DRAFT_2991 [Thermoascus thermophilus]